MDTVEIAEQIEAEFHSLLSKGDEPTPFVMEGAHLYGVDYTAEGTPKLMFIESHADVYDLLDNDYNALVASNYAWTLVVTTGWAAPLNANGNIDQPPSQHAERRRVRLACIANRQSVASVLRFADEPDDVITDEGKASGSLADAIQQFVMTGAKKSN
jgi:hypothetical protein